MLKNIAVDTVGELAANKVGINRESHGYWTHKIEHGLLGAGLGAALRHDDPAKGMIAGAAGAIVSEVIAEACARDMSGDMLEAYQKDAKEKGLPITREGFQAVLDSKVESIKKLAQLGGAAAGAIAGDVDVGSRMANNAIENNFAFVAVPWLIGAGMVAYSAYEINETFQRDGVEAALIHLGFEVVGYAAGAKVWGMAGKTGVAALEYVLAKSPFLKTLLGKTADKMAEYLGAAAATPLGQKVIQANSAVEAVAFQAASKVEEAIGRKFAFAGAPGGDAAKAVTAVKPNGGGAAKPEPDVMPAPKPAPKPKAESSPASSSQPEASSSGSSSSSSSSAPASSSQPSGSGSGNKGIYDSHEVRRHFEENYPGQVSSSTVPKANHPNVQYRGKEVPKTGAILDRKGYPIFDDHAKFDTKISRESSLIRNADLHKRNATRILRDAINSGKVDAKQFTEKQLIAIQKGEAQIPGTRWHHHQDIGRMQLVPKIIHDKTGHVGGMNAWFFGAKR